MRIVTMREARTHLSRLVEQAAAGEPFIIARAGKPIVKVTAIETPAGDGPRRLGFLKGSEVSVPDDFDEMGRVDIEQAFSGRV